MQVFPSEIFFSKTDVYIYTLLRREVLNPNSTTAAPKVGTMHETTKETTNFALKCVSSFYVFRRRV